MISRTTLANAKRLRGSQSEACDARRTEWLAGEGFRVLRFWNNDVLRDTESVLEAIRMTLSPGPSPARGRGE